MGARYKPTIEDEKPKFIYGMDKQWWAWYGYVYSDKGDELLLNANIYPKPVVKWTGTITRNGETINVNSLGSGEFRQMQP
jgi:hypothetical protein